MTKLLTIRRAKLTDLENFRLSLGDIAEAQKLNIEYPQEALKAILKDKDTLAIENHTTGEILALGGHSECRGEYDGCYVWMVTSDALWRQPKAIKLEFYRIIILYRNTLIQNYLFLTNIVWKGNTRHIRFLKSIGAKFLIWDKTDFFKFIIGKT